MKKFDYSLDFKTINFRKHPELHQVGKGEQESDEEYISLKKAHQKRYESL